MKRALSLLLSSALALTPMVAWGQTYPAPTLPLAGTEVTPCIQNGGYKACTTGGASSILGSNATISGAWNIGTPSAGVLTNATGLPASAVVGISAPINYLPNTQWEIGSSLSYGPRENIAGTGTMAAITMTGYTTGGTSSVLSVSGSTGDLKVGDLITVSGSGVSSALTASPMRVTALVANTSITVHTPAGLVVGATATGTIQPVNIGMSGGTTGAAFDGWSKTSTLTIWREDNAVNVPVGATYSMGVSKDLAAGSPEYIVTTNSNIKDFAGRTISLGFYVYQKVRGGSGTWQPLVNVGAIVLGNAAPTTAGWNWVEMNYTVPSSATFVQFGLQLNGAAGDTYYVANPVVTFGNYIGANNYSKPHEDFTPNNGIVPITWGLAPGGATINFPATAVNVSGYYDIYFDAYAETGGQIAPSVINTEGQLEGRDDLTVQTSTGAVRAIGFRNNASGPNSVGGIIPQYVATVKSFTTMNITLDGTGHAWANSGVASDVWNNVALEFDRFFLH